MKRRVVSGSRASPEEIRERRIHAESDPDILSMNVTTAMRRFKLNYENVMRIRRRLMEEKLQAGSTEEILQLNRDKRIMRLRGRVIRAEARYPMVHRRMWSEKNQSKIAESYDISRERVRQLRKQFSDLVRANGKSVKEVLDEVEDQSSK